jgi:hypothetical protein
MQSSYPEPIIISHANPEYVTVWMCFTSSQLPLLNHVSVYNDIVMMLREIIIPQSADRRLHMLAEGGNNSGSEWISQKKCLWLLS